MFGWLATQLGSWLEFLAPFLFKKKGTILFLGLENAGKTSLMYRLKTGKMIQAQPTPLPTNEALTLGKITFNTYDLGGHKQVRRVWRDYTPTAHGIIYLIDSSDREAFPEAKAELDHLLSDQEIAEIPFAILLNKIDTPGAADDIEIMRKFNLTNTTERGKLKGEALQGRRPLEVFPCSVLREQGYGAAFKWIAEYF